MFLDGRGEARARCGHTSGASCRFSSEKQSRAQCTLKAAGCGRGGVDKGHFRFWERVVIRARCGRCDGDEESFKRRREAHSEPTPAHGVCSIMCRKTMHDAP